MMVQNDNVSEKMNTPRLPSLGARHGGFLVELEGSIFRKCIPCEGMGRFVTKKDGKSSPLSLMPYLFPEGTIEASIAKCDECNGRGRVLTYAGTKLAEILKDIPEMALESKSRYKKMEEQSRNKDEKA